MPIYEYRCARCGTVFDRLVAVGAGAPPCPACGGGVGERLVSRIAAVAASDGGAGGCGCGSACGCGGAN